jgi:hypothetical protein
MVMEKYPLSPGEKKCRVERETMNLLRQNMRKRLYEQYKEEQNGTRCNDDASGDG